jgi:hypothetical protein
LFYDKNGSPTKTLGDDDKGKRWFLEISNRIFGLKSSNGIFGFNPDIPLELKFSNGIH